MGREGERSELRPLLRLGIPTVITQVGQMLLGVVETLYAGRVGVAALDAVSHGNVWQYGTLFPMFGIVIGYDPIASQAFGAGRGDEVALGLQRAVLVALGLSVLVALSWLYTAEMLMLMGQRPELAHAAALYVRTQMFSIPAMLVYGALSVFLTSRGIVRPGNVVMVVANLFNALVSWALVFGKWGVPALGIRGAALGIGLTRVVMLLALLVLVVRLQLYRGAWVRWSRRVLDGRALWRQLGLGLPNGFTLALELWAFQLGTLIAGRISHVALGAHAIALNLASLLFMVPLGLSIGTAVRVGQLIGAGDKSAAQVAAQTALKLIGAYSLCMGAALALGSAILPSLYTNDAAVLAAAASVLPIAGAFQAFDGLQAAGTGIMRGMGKPRVTAWFNAVGYFAIGIPLAYYLGLRTELGLRGVWLGYAAGLCFVATGLVSTVLMRGPRTAKALITTEPMTSSRRASLD